MTRTPDGCHFPDTVLGGRLTGAAPSGSIEVTINSDCSIEVEEVVFTEDTEAAGAAQQASPLRLRGWAKNELNDVANIDLTAVYARMYYWDYGRKVQGGHDPTNWCGAFSYPLGWYVHRCCKRWWPSGPSTVYVKTEGHFRHGALFTVRIRQHARFYAAPGWGDYECGHSGSVPGPVHWRCSGSRFAH